MEEGVDKAAASLGGCRLETPASTPSLPDEMVFEFLLRLPIRNLHQCNCVSKIWRSLISSPEFIQAYKDRHPDVGLLVAVPDISRPSKINQFYYSALRIHEPEEFVSRFQVPCPGYDCDEVTEVVRGLVCFYNRNSLFVCNIFTREVMPLPHSRRARKYFFGFDGVNGVYKLLGVNLGSVEILTLGLGSDCCWRIVRGDFENESKRTALLSPELVPEVRSICISGVLYWMVARARSRWKARCYLVSFDLSEEKFRHIKIPRGLTSRCLLSHCFVKFRGRLALSVPTYTGGYRLSLRILEDEEGHSWTKHSIALPEELNNVDGMLTSPVGNLPNGQMLLVNPLVEDLPTPVFSYDHQTCKFERLFVGKFPLLDLREIIELGVNISFAVNMSCVEENLFPLKDLFSGVKQI